LLVYLDHLNARSRYTFKTVFKSFLQFEEIQLTKDEEKFKAYEGPKLSYGSKKVVSELHFQASGLLSKKGINELKVEVGEYKNIPTLFPFQNAQVSALPFDVFSAVFFMLSRYEEYLPHRRDRHDRFMAEEGIAFKHKFLQTAVVDRWIILIGELIETTFSELNIQERYYRHLPTVDIDNAYAYLQKGLLRQVGSLSRSVVQMNWLRLQNQVEVLLGRRKDPFDTFNYLRNLQKKHKIKPIYFFLLADYGINDKNISYQNRKFQGIIKTVADYAEIGIHPSYASNARRKKLGSEVRRLERIVKREVVKSRQHFLKLKLPDTYRNLIDHDIAEDHTMGFAEYPGFRAGTCTPYLFYDLDEEVERKLLIVPFQLMDATLKYYMKVDIDQAQDEVHKIIDEVKAVKGTFISLWHNESLSDEEEWKGWRKVYEDLLSYAQ